MRFERHRCEVGATSLCGWSDKFVMSGAGCRRLLTLNNNLAPMLEARAIAIDDVRQRIFTLSCGILPRNSGGV